MPAHRTTHHPKSASQSLCYGRADVSVHIWTLRRPTRTFIGATAKLNIPLEGLPRSPTEDAELWTGVEHGSDRPQSRVALSVKPPRSRYHQPRVPILTFPSRLFPISRCSSRMLLILVTGVHIV